MKRKQTTDQRGPERSRRYYDIVGLSLTGTGIACLVWLVLRQHAPVPGILISGLRWFAGVGAFAAPLLMVFVGVMLLFGYKRFSFSHATYGSILAFLTFVTWRHLQGDPGALPPDVRLDGPLGAMVTDPRWSQPYVENAGGYLGAILGWALSSLFGSPASGIFLAMFALISLVLIVDRPLAEMIRSLGKPAQAGVDAARKGVVAIRERKENGRVQGDVLDATEDVIQQDAEGRSGLIRRLTRREVLEPDDGNEADPAPPRRTRPSRVVPLPPAAEEGAAEPEAIGPGPRSDPMYALPPTSILRDAPTVVNRRAQQEHAERIKILEKTLDEFGIGANVVEIAHGPTVTRYEVQLAPGINVARISALAGNIAMALAAHNVRVEAPIPGKAAIGIEVPNSTKAVVSFKECVESAPFRDPDSRLLIALGKDVSGQIRVADLATMPHLLIGGATNSGKSVCLNALIASIVYRARPDEVKFIMVDPKRVELSLWDGIPHLIHPVVTDVKQASGIFRAVIREMDRRYDRLAAQNARNIASYNAKAPEGERLPFLIVVVDELAELMAQAAAEIETSIERLAHLARATGIHLVIATQRPSVDVITGRIKANIPSRIAFACIQAVDSRTILDRVGAERLIGRGDMLFLPIDAQGAARIQGCYLSEEETEEIVQYLRTQDTPDYTMRPIEATPDGAVVDAVDADDELFEKAVRLVVSTGHASASLLQRRMRIGYARSSRLVDMMEQQGIVGPQDGAKLREVLITRDDVDRMFGPPA